MNTAINKHLSTIIFLIFFFASMGFHIFWWTQKDGFHWDEPEGIRMAVYDSSDTERALYLTEYTGKQAKEVYFGTDGSPKWFFNKIAGLWKKKSDMNHGNLYNILQAIFLVGLRTSESEQILLRGAILNLFLFALSFCFFYLLMCLLFRDKKIFASVITFCTFLSTATLSNNLLMRPYMLQETMLIIFVYMFVKYIDIQKIKTVGKKIQPNLPLMVCMSLITALSFLSGYFSTLFVGFLGLYAIFYNLAKKQYNEIPAYFLILAGGFIFSVLLDPNFFHLIKYPTRASEITSYTLTTFGFFDNLELSLKTILHNLYKYWWTVPVLCVTGFTICYTTIFAKIKKIKLEIYFPCVIIFASALAFAFITMILALPALKVLRYGVASYSFFILLPAIFINNIKNKYVYVASLVLLCIAMSLNSFNANNFQHLFHNKPAEYKFTQVPELPVLILEGGPPSMIVPYFEDTQRYVYFADFKNFANRLTEMASPKITINDSGDVEIVKKLDGFHLILPQTYIASHPINFEMNSYDLIDTYDVGACPPETIEPYFRVYYFMLKQK
ncbi:MAG: hypothetical protein Ta2B_19230 [Termitinemataceae bacterium]|nr:MAG: hypothetical protein Ta2B_19230 [Termitinemataceae bacterium]